MADEVSNWYWEYKEKSTTAARLSRFENIPLENQLATLVELGLVLHPVKSKPVIERIMQARPKYERDPFDLLLGALVDDEGTVESGEVFDTECIGGEGSYVFFANMFRRLAMGDFKVSDLEDYEYGDNAPDGRTIGQAWLALTFNGRRYKWKAKYNSDWVDFGILRKMGKLLASSGSHKRFISLQSGDQMATVLCLPASAVEQFTERTGLRFELLI